MSKLLAGFVLVLLLVTSVSAEIVYSDRFYENQNLSQSYMHVDKLQERPLIWSEYSSVFEQRNTNELLMKQNELLQEQNNLTITQNEILSEIYNLGRLWFGYKITGILGATYGKPLDV